MNNDYLFIPANPPVGGYGSKAYREAQAANQADALNVRERATRQRFVIPPPPVDEQIPVPPPAQRRNFGNGPSVSGRSVRRD